MVETRIGTLSIPLGGKGMHVTVGTKPDNDPEILVIQRNQNPALEPDNKITFGSGVIAVWVPAQLAGVSSQIDEKSWKSFVECYRLSIESAAGMGMLSIGVSELGCGRLLWKSLRSAQAAKQAVDECWNIVPDEMRVCFIVPKESLQDWGDVMRF